MVNSTHNHENEEDSVEISSHKRTMKKEVEKNRRKYIKKEFNECSRNATEKARNNVPYVKVQNTLYKLNRKFEPNRPKNAQEYVDGLRSKPETYGKYFLSSYGVDGVTYGALFGTSRYVGRAGKSTVICLGWYF